MPTRIAIAALALSLVGAAAYAVAQAVEAKAPIQRMTIIEKNQSWPVKGLMTMDPCAALACLEV